MIVLVGELFDDFIRSDLFWVKCVYMLVKVILIIYWFFVL